jgi:predicted Holliday junction resolvase-like endonuclease
MNDGSLLLFTLLIAAVVFILIVVAKSGANVDSRAHALFETWKKMLLNSERTNLRESMKLEFERWKSDEEQKIRFDSLQRSDHTHFGKMIEHLVPWMVDCPFDPRDMRFLGSPVDFVAFEGLSSGKEVTVVLIEVKTGRNDKLTVREQKVRDAVNAGRVGYRIIKVQRPLVGNNL